MKGVNLENLFNTLKGSNIKFTDPNYFEKEYLTFKVFERSET